MTIKQSANKVQESMADAEFELWWDYIAHRDAFIKKMCHNPKELAKFLDEVLKNEHLWWKELHQHYCEACGEW